MDRSSVLETLGLTQLEAASYRYLVANPSSTGYRIAQGIGKPTANVYRALESLGRKGAVLTDRGTPPSYHAVAPDELLNRFERDFLERKRLAARELSLLHRDEPDERVYALKTPEQVIGRTRVLLTATRKVALLHAGRGVAAAIADAIADARTRGARVVARVPEGALPEHADTTFAAEPRAHRAGTTDLNPLRICADAREALMALPSDDLSRVSDAIWTRSAFFARTLHDALAAELFFTLTERGLSDGLSVDEVEEAFERCRGIRDLS